MNTTRVLRNAYRALQACCVASNSRRCTWFIGEFNRMTGRCWRKEPWSGMSCHWNVHLEDTKKFMNARNWNPANPTQAWVFTATLFKISWRNFCY